MTDQDRELARVRNPVLSISAAGWVLLLIEPGAIAHCAIRNCPGSSWWELLQMGLVANPPAVLAAGWGVMLLAMMGPALIPPIHHVRMQSLQRRRTGAITLFVVGYAAMWLPVSILLLGIELTTAPLALQPYVAIAATFVTLAWQLSPWKQLCLNRGHMQRPLAPFGFAAYRDALRFGMAHGIWCAGSCWALMLLPMLLPRGHVAAMAAAGFVLFSERLERPAPPRWRWRFSSKLARMLIAQTQIRLAGCQRVTNRPPIQFVT
jgi:predicted metal-binding membrane protein